mmetsp:Transcript_74924/g.193360  ORF Transcript_74924/g.193360 Transcript_74924/m.193360 type:complete len:182 (-) Transcript_74924:93-638(-)
MRTRTESIPMDVDGVGEGAIRMAAPVPGPMTPIDSPPATHWAEEEKENLKACGRTHLEDTNTHMKRFDDITEDILPARKRVKVPASMEGCDSLVSTATSTPVGTPISSPLLSPSVDALPALPPLRADYQKMTVPELREQLLGSGSCAEDLNIAVGWEKEELVAVLEELDRICSPFANGLEI